MALAPSNSIGSSEIKRVLSNSLNQNKASAVVRAPLRSYASNGTARVEENRRLPDTAPPRQGPSSTGLRCISVRISLTESVYNFRNYIRPKADEPRYSSYR